MSDLDGREAFGALEDFIASYAWRDSADYDEVMRLLDLACDRTLPLPTDKDGEPLTLNDRVMMDGHERVVLGIGAGGIYYSDKQTDTAKRIHGITACLAKFRASCDCTLVKPIDESEFDYYDRPRKVSAYRWLGDFVTDGEYDCPRWCMAALEDGTLHFDGQAELYLEDEHVPIGAWLLRYHDSSILWCSADTFAENFTKAVAEVAR